jgi:hypothetical protein
VLVTRSARDISISWSVLYSIGLTLSLAYLVLKVSLDYLVCMVSFHGSLKFLLTATPDPHGTRKRNLHKHAA